MSSGTTRDNQWLEGRVRHLWNTYYQDAPTGYPVVARFGPRARYRFGSIYSAGKTCHILVNHLFAHPDVPEYVVDATLAHELAHYVHGWGSGLRKLHSHPHRGGVVDREMQARGCFFLEEKASAWRKANWQAFYAAHAGEALSRRTERERRDSVRWELYLASPGYRTEAQIQARAAELAVKFDLAEIPFQVGWLTASVRRTGLSYRFRRENTARLHGTLADPMVPSCVVDYELCYWLAGEVAGSRWEEIENAMRQAGVWPSAEKAIRWRRKVWPDYLRANHPLRAK